MYIYWTLYSAPSRELFRTAPSPHKVNSKNFLTNFPTKFSSLSAKLSDYVFLGHRPLFSIFSLARLWISVSNTLNFTPMPQVPSIFQMFLHYMFYTFAFPSHLNWRKTFVLPKNAKFPPKMGIMKISASFPHGMDALRKAMHGQLS